MSTTIVVSEATRDRLARAKRLYGARSLDQVIDRLLTEATPSAEDLFKANRRKVLQVCRKYGLAPLVAFGSRVRDDRTPASDLDLVAGFPPGTSLFDVIEIRDALSAAFGCKVDLGSLPPPGSRLARHIEEEGVELVGAPS